MNLQRLRLMLRLPDGTERVCDRAGPLDDVDSACFELLTGAGGRVIDHYTITGEELRGLGDVGRLLQALMEKMIIGVPLADAVMELLPKSGSKLRPLFLVRIAEDPERLLLIAGANASVASVAAAAEARFDMPVTEVKFLGAVDVDLDVEVATLSAPTIADLQHAAAFTS